MTGTKYNYQARDHFSQGYVFPLPTREANGEVSLPTYKRDINCQACVTLNNQLGGAEDQLLPLCRQCYSGLDYNQARGEVDMGWLDRVGYRIINSGMVSVVSEEVHDIPEALAGDHAPVYMLITLTIS